MSTFEWTDPLPVGVGGAANDPFPLEALPNELREYVEYLRGSMNGADTGLIVCAVLWTLCTAQGPAWIKPDNRYEEPSPLWFLPVATSGTMKSPVIGAVTKALEDAEKRIRKIDAQDRTVRKIKYNAVLDKFETAKSDLSEELAADTPDPAKVAELSAKVTALEVEHARAYHELGSIPQVMLAGASSSDQGIHDLLAEHRHIGVCMTEGVDMFNGLSNPQNKSRETWLKGHDMGTTHVQLRTSTVAAVEEGSMPLLTAVQTPIVRKMVMDNAKTMLASLGIFARYLPAQATETQLGPQTFKDAADLAGSQMTGVAANSAETQWHALIEREVARTWLNRGHAIHFQLDPVSRAKDAHAREFAIYRLELNAMMAAANPDEANIEASLSKLRGQVLRIARLFAQMKIVTTRQNAGAPFGMSGTNPDIAVTLSTEFIHLIDADSIERAWIIARWFFRQYKRLFSPDVVNEDIASEKLMALVLHKTAALTEDGEFITLRRLQRDGNISKTTKELEPAVNSLVALGWLKPARAPRHGVVYYPHPQIRHFIKTLEVG